MKTHWFVRCLVASAASLALAVPASAAVDYFLKIDNVKGESTVKGHEGEIEVLAWSWGMSRGATDPRGAGGMAASKPCVSDIAFTKYLDLATPLLIANLMSGMTIPKAKLTGLRSGETQVEFLVIELTGILISSLQDSGGGGEQPIESLALRFAGAKVSYRPQGPDGKPGTPVETTFKAGAC